MRVLLVHPEDSLRSGPWAGQKWDLVVDLGRSSESAQRSWEELSGCPVLRLESFRRPVDDPRAAGEILCAGNGVLVDSDGLDWWEMTSLFVHAEIETVILLRRLVAAASLPKSLYATRMAWPVNALALLTNATVQTLDTGGTAARSPFERYCALFRKFSPGQIAEIFFDKYDGGYAWRGAMTPRRGPSRTPVVLLPSGYTNVSRVSANFARSMPEQSFLLIATRRSGLEFDPPENVSVSRLAAYASSSSNTEPQELLRAWSSLLPRLQTVPELETLFRLGILNRFPQWFRNGLRVRDAWKSVLDREPIQAVFCGDDSNWYTKLPVVLARKRGVPTVDFHHGAFDGRYLLKRLPSDWYLAKSEAELDYLVRVCQLPSERIVVVSPDEAGTPNRTREIEKKHAQILYFSEPYEASGGRPHEVYRELLPPLCRLAAGHDGCVVVKLHPFENAAERTQLLTAILSPEDRARVYVVAGPLQPDLVQQSWFGITVESTTVADCTRLGVPCFLCEWLVTSSFGYVQQFARFGIGRLLPSASEIARIPELLRGPAVPPAPAVRAASRSSAVLSELLAKGPPAGSATSG